MRSCSPAPFNLIEKNSINIQQAWLTLGNRLRHHASHCSCILLNRFPFLLHFYYRILYPFLLIFFCLNQIHISYFFSPVAPIQSHPPSNHIHWLFIPWNLVLLSNSLRCPLPPLCRETLVDWIFSHIFQYEKLYIMTWELNLSVSWWCTIYVW